MESGRNVPGEENKYLSRRNSGERNLGAGEACRGSRECCANSLIRDGSRREIKYTEVVEQCPGVLPILLGKIIGKEMAIVEY